MRPTLARGTAQTQAVDSPNESSRISTPSSPATSGSGTTTLRSSQPVDSTVGKPGTTLGRGRVLVVEDHGDLRRMLATALEMDGHDVDEAGDAREGLARLASTRYDLVLTDYAMPGETGTWMLHEATRLGFMHDAVALIVTAHPGVREISEVEVITKPLDLDNFLEQVRRILSLSSDTVRAREAGECAQGRSGALCQLGDRHLNSGARQPATAARRVRRIAGVSILHSRRGVDSA
jgi:DNA-binding response OmpR family regulator